jgi:carbon storage regulator CsrA
MLILTRRIGEKIVINDDLIITVIRIDGGQVKFAFDDPDYKYTIDRLEKREAMNALRKQKKPREGHCLG